MSKALVFVELDLDYCALRYGETTDAGTCPAVLGVDSQAKCFNTKSTCAVRPSYLSSTVTLRFAEGTAYLAESGIDAIACIEDIAFTPGTISLGEDLGTRSSLRVTMSDFPWSDAGPGFDKYVAERPYDPFKQGTFWGKFRPRHPSLRGRALRVIRGYLGQSIEEMETRHYVVESVDGPTPDGRYAIIAKDALKLLDGDRAQAPRLSNGFLFLDLDDSETTAQLAPAGIGNIEYPTHGYVAIGGKEICHFYRDRYAGLNANTILLLHFDGADGATTFPDASASARTATAVGNAQLDDTHARFNATSLYLDGDGDYVTLPDSNDWTFAGDFTIDCWAMIEDFSSFYRPLFSHQTDASNQYLLNVTEGGTVAFGIISGGSPLLLVGSAEGLVEPGEWHHYAVVRSGDTWTLYLDGVAVGSETEAVSIPNFTSTFRIGADGGAANVMKGWIDEFRVSNVARWTADFEAPGGPYNTSSDLLTLRRAQYNTEASEHKTADRVQLCIEYISTDVSDILADLMVNYASVPGEWIPLDAWKDETTYFLRTLYTTLIAEPTSVQTLCKELIRQATLAVWWDDVNSLIRLRVLRQIATDAALFDESVVVEKTLSVSDQPEKRLSRVWVYFGQVNPLKKVDDADNYRSCVGVVNLEREDDYGAPAIEKIYSRWIPEGGRAIAERIGNILIGRFSRPPRKFKLAAFRSGPVLPVAGVGCRLSAWPFQNAMGGRIEVPAQVIRIDPRSDFFVTELEEFDFSFVDDGDPTVIFDLDAFNVNVRSIFNFFYPPPEEGDDVYIIVERGVKIGSKNVAIPAMTMGDWPAGVNVHLIVRGRIQGKGGDGGKYIGGVGQPGQAGGAALYTRYPIIIDNAPATDVLPAGQIWGGGGGGGAAPLTGEPGQGVNGGGGAGYLIGIGGVTATAEFPITWNGQDGTTETGGDGGTVPLMSGGAGGNPGNPGAAGSAFIFPLWRPGAAGGAAGAAIDGESHVTVIEPGDIRGPQIN